MDFHVPNSDDEGHAIYTSRGYGDSVAAIDKVYSDDDDEMWALPSNRLPVQATPRTAPPPPAPERRFTFGRRPTLTGGGATKSSRPTAGGRRLVSNAVAERRAAAAAQAQQEQEQENTALQTIDWPLTSTSQPVLHHNCSLPAFIGRTPPASLKPMPVSTTTTTTATARETSTAPRNPIRSSTLAHAGRSLESGSSSLGRQPDELSAHHRPSSTTAGGGSSDDHHQHHHQSSTGMREHVNDDGMTVLINQRKRCRGDIGINNEDDMKEGGGKAINKKKPSVNSGWGNNFVRIDMKVSQVSTIIYPSSFKNICLLIFFFSYCCYCNNYCRKAVEAPNSDLLGTATFAAAVVVAVVAGRRKDSAKWVTVQNSWKDGSRRAAPPVSSVMGKGTGRKTVLELKTSTTTRVEVKMMMKMAVVVVEHLFLLYCLHCPPS